MDERENRIPLSTSQTLDIIIMQWVSTYDTDC